MRVEQTLLTATEDHGIGAEMSVSRVLQVKAGKVVKVEEGASGWRG